ncbi:hypothetical protein [Mesorhizobium sp. B1-1-6]|uniref:hypothetical protein n=1 Tax=Mesorhizobium sp. B1-1-6 TaxID=2589978 RepID=UPI0011263EE6|nr:hypothetical protein [Mesorhizobium sp. B1-1-6]TPN29157.1 hypothetical protein FJ979_32015 [Mesorhizobium sp. B1-1-6]
MTLTSPDKSPEKHCPKCGTLIPAAAVVCPVCQSDIADRKQNRLVAIAKFTRDWIGFPVAVVTAITALIGPARNAVLASFGRDGPTLSLKYVENNIANDGLLDTPIFEQPNEIFRYIPYMRYVLINNGPTSATVETTFSCFHAREHENGFIVGNFYFADLRTQKRIAADPKLGPGESILVDVVVGDISPVESPEPGPKDPVCQLPFTDKYGARTFTFAPVVESDAPSLFGLGGAEDRRVALRKKYCLNMTQGLRLGAEPVDCIDDTHVIAIEPIYLWESALQRALKQSSDFHQLTQGAAARTPGLVLTGCPDNPDKSCEDKPQEMMQALRTFTPPLTVWQCPPEERGDDGPKTVDFKKVCRRTDFPLAAQ